VRSSNPPCLGARAIWLPFCLLLSGCFQPPTQGPIVDIGEDGWIADPPTIAQTRERFEVTLVNSLDTSVSFIIVRMDYGEVTDLPLLNGVVDVNRQVVYEVDDPMVLSPPLVAYSVVYPDNEEIFNEGTAPVLEPGQEGKVTIGNPGLGGGEPGSFAVISHDPGGLERGDYATFNLTDENGQVPRMSLDDFCLPDPLVPLQVGDRLLPWKGPLLGGHTFDSESLAGGPALILLFIAEPDGVGVLEVFKAVVEAREGEIQGVVVAPWDNEETLEQLIDETEVTLRVVTGDSCHLQVVFRLGFEPPPYWIVTDGNGVIVGVEYGPRSMDQVQSLITESAPTT